MFDFSICGLLIQTRINVQEQNLAGIVATMVAGTMATSSLGSRCYTMVGLSRPTIFPTSWQQCAVAKTVGGEKKDAATAEVMWKVAMAPWCQLCAVRNDYLAGLKNIPIAQWTLWAGSRPFISPARGS